MSTNPSSGIIPAGSLIIFRLGLDEEAYNAGAYRAKQDIHQGDAIDNYVMYLRDEQPEEKPYNEGFRLRMIEKEMIEEVPKADWDLGDHMGFDPRRS
ncbi:MAG: hypothetical protein WAP03_30655 [Methylorubrum rhodinum]|uniref:hypothetical protein n=1 Tax=Methylorubrum rhodinum TaxID=29428 RepID=UPI003BB12DF8